MSEDAALPVPAPIVCTNCGDARVGVYCAECGEKQPHHQDLTMGHFTHEVVHELLHLDSKLFRTLRDLVARPGELTLAYFGGRKKRFVAPLRLFLTLFALQFLAYTAYKPVAVYSIEGLMSMDPAHNLDRVLEMAAMKQKIPPAQLYERIDYRWQKTMSLLSLLNIAGIAIMLQLLYLRHRRFLAEHFVFAAHFLCFTYLLSLAMWPLYAILGMRQSGFNAVMSVVTMGIACVYLFFGLRRYYGQGGGKAILKSIAVAGGMFATTMILVFGSLIVALVQVL